VIHAPVERILEGERSEGGGEVVDWLGENPSQVEDMQRGREVVHGGVEGSGIDEEVGEGGGKLVYCAVEFLT
jgi:hypothetical protein